MAVFTCILCAETVRERMVSGPSWLPGYRVPGSVRDPVKGIRLTAIGEDDRMTSSGFQTGTHTHAHSRIHHLQTGTLMHTPPPDGHMHTYTCTLMHTPPPDGHMHTCTCTLTHTPPPDRHPHTCTLTHIPPLHGHPHTGTLMYTPHRERHTQFIPIINISEVCINSILSIMDELRWAKQEASI